MNNELTPEQLEELVAYIRQVSGVGDKSISVDISFGLSNGMVPHGAVPEFVKGDCLRVWPRETSTRVYPKNPKDRHWTLTFYHTEP